MSNHHPPQSPKKEFSAARKDFDLEITELKQRQKDIFAKVRTKLEQIKIDKIKEELKSNE